MKRLVWIIIAVFALQACKEHTGYTIKGDLADADGQKVVLKKVTIDMEPVGIDSCVVKNGKFEMKGTVEYPEYSLLYVGKNGPAQFFVENSVIDVVFDLKNMQDSKITGSKENDLFDEFNNGMAEFEKSIKKVNDDYMSLKLSGETDAEKEKGYLAQMDEIRQQRIDYMMKFTTDHPNSMVTALVVDKTLSYYITADQMETYANGFDEVNSKSPWVQSIKEKAGAAKRLAEGQPAPDIKLPAPNGDVIALSDYTGKDKYVLIDFWASWCRPCRMANPHVVKLYNKYKDKGFEIVGISLDRDKGEWVQAIEADGLTWPQMSDLKFWQSAAAKLYSVNSIPYTVLLDKEGKILAKGLQPNDLEKKLAELLETNDKDK